MIESKGETFEGDQEEKIACLEIIGDDEGSEIDDRRQWIHSGGRRWSSTVEDLSSSKWGN